MSPFMFPHYECAVFKDGLRAFDRKWYIVVGSVAVTILGTQQRLLILLLHFDSISCMPRATVLYPLASFHAPGATSYFYAWCNLLESLLLSSRRLVRYFNPF
jgi:hypothetical protein